MPAQGKVLVWSAKPDSTTRPVISTALGKPDETARRFVRSHAMRGKNTREDRRARRHAKQSLLDGSPSGSESWVPTTPYKIACELALDRWGLELKPYMLELLHRAFTVVKPATYTIETVLVDRAQAHLVCVADIHMHPAMIHAVMFTTQAFYDKSMGQAYSSLVLAHQAQTLYHLQQSLNHWTEALTPATLTVITTLASSAAIMGDIEALEKHMDGLYQVVQALGGLKTIEQGSMVEHKAQRLDLGLAMGTGRKPRFFPDDISWSPQLARAAFAAKVQDLKGVQPPPEPRLLNIWYDLKHFSAAANRATATGTKMSPEVFSRLSTSVPNRLVHLSYDATSLDELLRLSMLAYVKGLLVQIPGLGRKMWHLSDGLEAALQTQQYPPRLEIAGILLWALVMAGLTIFEDFSRKWHREAIIETAAVLDIYNWVDARLLLRDVLWVDMVFDPTAEALLKGVFDDVSNETPK